MKGAAAAAVEASDSPAQALGVVVQCHDVACALSTRWVERLVLPEDVNVLGAKVAVSHGQRYALWDLGELLGLAPLAGSWVLMKLPHAGRTVAIALRTGPCLCVQALPRRVKLPAPLFVSRVGAIAGVFASTAAHRGALCGLELDLSRLWTKSELSASVALLHSQNA